MESNNFELVLGSQSPRRKELLSWTNLKYTIVTADLDEISHKTKPEDIAVDLALQKARAVKTKLLSKNNFIISADTIVVLEGKIYGKPKDREDAEKILSELSGNTHEVITGVCFIYENNEHLFFDKTLVTFNEIDPDLMQAYLDTGDSLDKAGAYGIQGPSLTFIAKIEGSYSNVVGFPLDKIIKELKSLFGSDWKKKFISA
jgi:septum formation protein